MSKQQSKRTNNQSRDRGSTRLYKLFFLILFFASAFNVVFHIKHLENEEISSASLVKDLKDIRVFKSEAIVDVTNENENDNDNVAVPTGGTTTTALDSDSSKSATTTHATKSESSQQKTTTTTTSSSSSSTTTTTKVDNSKDNTKSEDGEDGKERVRNILKASGEEITPEIESKIPTWTEVKSLYGSSTKIIGLDTCDQFQSIIPVEDAYIGPAGIFNTGTNLLSGLLQSNCEVPKRTKKGSGLLWQVPWGKHNPVSFRLNHKATGQSRQVEHQDHVLPVVTIKDPYHWMGSMCRHSYAANWYHDKEHCPNLIPNKYDDGKRGGIKIGGGPIAVNIRFQPKNVSHYESLAAIWNDWYGDYLIADFPRLIVRFEDILFHLEETLTAICECGGGRIRKDASMHIKSESAKGSNGPHTGASGLYSAIKRYGHTDQRLDGMTQEDLEYAQETLNKDMMELFGYSFPEIKNVTEVAR